MPGDRTRVESEYIAVEKWIEERARHPIVRLRVATYHTQPTRVRLVQALPDGFSVDDVAFHPDYCQECWHREDDRLVFERAFDWGETVDTGFAVDAPDAEPCAPFLEPPLVELIDVDGTVIDTLGDGGDDDRRHAESTAPSTPDPSRESASSDDPSDTETEDEDAQSDRSSGSKTGPSEPETLDELFSGSDEE